MGELGKRVAVAAVAVPGILGSVALGGVPFLTFICGMVALGAWELSRLVEVKGVRVPEPLILSCALLPVLGWCAGGEVAGLASGVVLALSLIHI